MAVQHFEGAEFTLVTATPTWTNIMPFEGIQNQLATISFDHVNISILKTKQVTCVIYICIWIHTYIHMVHSVECVSKIKSIISVIFQYIGLCVFSRPMYLMIIGRIHVLYLIIIIKSEVWPICQCLLSGHGTMVCAVCLYMFLRERSHR